MALKLLVLLFKSIGFVGPTPSDSNPGHSWTVSGRDSHALAVVVINLQLDSFYQ